jgi:putative aldouronate transport system permease protein
MDPSFSGTSGRGAFYPLNVAFLILFCLVMLYPYANVVAKAFNEGFDTIQGGITVYPRVPTLRNFRTLFRNQLVLRSGLISVARALSGTALALVVQFSAAYAMKRRNLKGRSGILIFLMIPMFFGGGLIPVYILYSRLDLLNNFLVYILPGAFSLFNMVIIRTYLRTIPESFEEAAKMDGANEIAIMFRILLPLSKPILATIALWTLVYHWNDWVTTLYFVTKSKLFTMQFVLMRILRESEEIQKMVQESIKRGQVVHAGTGTAATPESIQAAQIVLTTIPIIITYPFLQKYFIKGVMIGAIKE